MVEIITNPLLVNKEKLQAFIGEHRTIGSSTETLEMNYPYLDDNGNEKTFTLSMTLVPFEDNVIIVKASGSAKTGYKKYGERWTIVVQSHILRMVMGGTDKVTNTTITTDKGTFIDWQVLIGVDSELKPVFTHYYLVKEKDVETVLIDEVENQQYYLFDGTVYTNSQYGGTRLSFETHYNNYLKRELFLQSKDLYYLVIDGNIYTPLCPITRLRFGFVTDPGEKYGQIRVMEKYSDRASAINRNQEQCETLQELKLLARALNLKNEEAFLTQFSFIHPNLLGDPIPNFHEGDDVYIHLTDEVDKRYFLNGQKGQVKKVLYTSVEVEFLGYFVEKFSVTELKKKTSYETM